jgi:hypothetical protein
LPESGGHLPLATMALIFRTAGLLLARDALAFMTGSVLVVDGGHMVSSL